MPGYTRNKKRDVQTFVAINDVLLYGFNTKDLSAVAGISSSDLSGLLGHQGKAAVMAATGKILILGAQSPKPPRVSKKIANAAAGTQQSASTFCAKGSLALAVADGWKVNHRGRSVTLRPANAASGSQTAVAELSDGSLYAFSLNKEDFTSYAAMLGLKSAATVTTDAERKKLVMGSSYPRPGRAKIKLDAGGTFQCFFSTAKAGDLGTNGFDIIEEEIILAL